MVERDDDKNDVPGTPGWVYETTRRLFGRSLRMFFRQIEVEGAEHIPAAGGGIVIAWHPNAIIDGMLLASECPRPITFAGRHGVFGIPLFGWLARRLGAVPVYRASDVTDEETRRAANERSLDAMACAVAAGRLTAIFPEGQSHDAPHLTRFKTGAARLFDRARRMDPEGALPFVIPAGLDYGAKDLGRSTALLRFYPPLELPAELTEGPVGETEEAFFARMRSLTDVFERALHEIVLSTDDWASHELMHRTRKLIRAEVARRRKANPGPASPSEKRAGLARIWTAYQQTSRRDPKGTELFLQQLKDYDGILDRVGLEDHDLDNRDTPSTLRFVGSLLKSAVTLAALAPLALYAYVTNGPTAALLWCAARFGARGPKDRATIKVCGGMLVLPPTWIGAGLLTAYAWSRWIDPSASTVALLVVGASAAVLSVVGVYAAFTCLRQHRDLVECLVLGRAALFDDLQAISAGLDLPGKVTGDGRVRPD